MKNFKAIEQSDLSRSCSAIENEDGTWNYTEHYGDSDYTYSNICCFTVLKKSTSFMESVQGTTYLWNIEAHYSYKDIEKTDVSCFEVFRQSLEFFKDCQGCE